VSDVHSPVPQLFAVPVSRRRCCSGSNVLVSVVVMYRYHYHYQYALLSGWCQVPLPVPVSLPVSFAVPLPVPVSVKVPVPHFYRNPVLATCRNICISPSFVHNVALLCTAVCSTHNVTSSTAVCSTHSVTSSTASCVLLFNLLAPEFDI
jgi:hypothetical protein